MPITSMIYKRRITYYLGNFSIEHGNNGYLALAHRGRVYLFAIGKAGTFYVWEIESFLFCESVTLYAQPFWSVLTSSRIITLGAIHVLPPFRRVAFRSEKYPFVASFNLRGVNNNKILMCHYVTKQKPSQHTYAVAQPSAHLDPSVPPSSPSMFGAELLAALPRQVDGSEVVLGMDFCCHHYCRYCYCCRLWVFV
jgi:hypothetical protein